jgi:hypothetical protein
LQFDYLPRVTSSRVQVPAGWVQKIAPKLGVFNHLGHQGGYYRLSVGAHHVVEMMFRVIHKAEHVNEYADAPIGSAVSCAVGLLETI